MAVPSFPFEMIKPDGSESRQIDTIAEYWEAVYDGLIIANTSLQVPRDQITAHLSDIDAILPLIPSEAEVDALGDAAQQYIAAMQMALDNLAEGQRGPSAGARWTFDTSQVIADPGAGMMRINAAGTQIAVSETHPNGTSAATILNSAFLNGSLLYIADNLGYWSVYTLNTSTDNGTWRTLNVSGLAGSATPPAAGATLGVISSRQGNTGATGAIPGQKWTFSTTQTAGDPGGGFFRTNAAGTELYISETFTGGSTLGGVFLDVLIPGSTLYCVNPNNGWQGWRVTSQVDNGTWRTLTVTPAGAGGTAFANGNACSFVAAPKGDQGIQGIQGDQGIQGTVFDSYRGQWSAATAYVTGDIVAGRNGLFMALANNTNVGLTTTATWKLLAEGVVQIVRTSGTGAPGTTDTYTITYSSGLSSTFTVRHGTDGTGTVNTVNGKAVESGTTNVLIRGREIPLDAGSQTAGSTGQDQWLRIGTWGQSRTTNSDNVLVIDIHSIGNTAGMGASMRAVINSRHQSGLAMTVRVTDAVVFEANDLVVLAPDPIDATTTTTLELWIRAKAPHHQYQTREISRTTSSAAGTVPFTYANSVITPTLPAGTIWSGTLSEQDLPTRLRGATGAGITDLNFAVENGYWATGLSPANAPATGISFGVHVVRVDSSHLTQTAYAAQDNRIWIRSKINNGWGSWEPVIGTDGYIADTGLPPRLQSGGGNVNVTDHNLAIESGWWTSAGSATNAPNSTTAWVGLTVDYGPSNNYTQQTVWGVNNVQRWERTLINNVWSAWIRQDKAYLDTLYATIAATPQLAATTNAFTGSATIAGTLTIGNTSTAGSGLVVQSNASGQAAIKATVTGSGGQGTLELGSTAAGTYDRVWRLAVGGGNVNGSGAGTGSSEGTLTITEAGTMRARFDRGGLFQAMFGANVTGGDLSVDGARALTFNTTGVAAPTFTTRSAGTKIVLYPGIAAAAVDFAIGMEASTMWQSVSTSSHQFKWYAGTTVVGTLTGGGTLTIAGGLNTAGALTVAYSSLTSVLGNNDLQFNRAGSSSNITQLGLLGSLFFRLSNTGAADTAALSLSLSGGVAVTNALGTLHEAGQRVYSPNNKPSLGDLTGVVVDASLPARFRGNLQPVALADFDTALEPGFYAGSTTTTNMPVASQLTHLLVTGFNASNITQRAWISQGSTLADTKTYVRFRVNGVFSAWGQVIDTRAEADARYLQTSASTYASATAGVINEAALPERVRGLGQTLVTDMNTLTSNGFWRTANNPTNGPGIGAVALVGYTVNYSATYAVQTAFAMATTADQRKFQRTLNNGTWSSWTQLANVDGTAAEAYLPARLRALGGSTVTDLNAGDALITGFWTAESGAANLPVAGVGVVGITTKYGNYNWWVQRAFSASDGRSWTRQNINGTIGAWQLDTNADGTIADGELPARLRVRGGPSVADLNAGAALDAGQWYTGNAAANAPAALYFTGQTWEYGGNANGFRVQQVWDSNSTLSWMRQQVNGTWGAWRQVYQNDGTLGENMLPARLRSDTGPQNDMNLILTSGFWATAPVANGGLNRPSDSDAAQWMFSLYVGGPANGRQTSWQFNGTAADSKTWARNRVGSVWGAWERVRDNQTELDARYARVTDGALEATAAFPATTGTVTMNANTASHWYGTPTAAITLAFSNLTSGKAQTFTVEVIQGATAYAVTPPTGTIKWSGGTAPTQTANKTTLYTFLTRDGGATWLASAGTFG